jgi:hypothetical protein
VVSILPVSEYLCVVMMVPYEQKSVLNAGSTVHILVNVRRVVYDVPLHSHKICSMLIIDFAELPRL